VQKKQKFLNELNAGHNPLMCNVNRGVKGSLLELANCSSWREREHILIRK
jgi:hypothetical protein